MNEPNDRMAEIIARQGEIMRMNAELQREYRERRTLARSAATREAQARFKAAHPAAWDAIQKRRAVKHRVEVVASRADGELAYAADAIVESWKASESFECHYCHREIAPDQRTVDHVIPVSRGGQHRPSNIVRCCRRCNSRKNARSEYYP